MKTDMLSKPLEVGDYVYTIRKEYRDLVVARIVQFTPKQIRVIYPAGWTSNLHPELYLTSQVIKIETQDLVNIPSSTKQRLDQIYDQSVAAA